MTGAGGPPSAERVFGIIHGAMVASVVAVSAVFMWRSRGGTPPLADATLALRIAAAGALGVMTMAGFALDRTMARRPPGADRAVWWAANGPKALTLWGLAEGIALIGTVFWYLSGDVLVFVGLTGLGLATLIWNGPGRIAD